MLWNFSTGSFLFLNSVLAFEMKSTIKAISPIFDCCNLNKSISSNGEL